MIFNQGVQEPSSQTILPTISIYIHWPFCKSKCPYCDFNSHVKEPMDMELFEQAYFKEISYYDHILQNRVITTIFFGGGTPTLSRPQFIEKLLNFIKSRYKVAQDLEITMEANPTSVESKKFSDLRNGGINRVSIGVQSLNEKHLQFLGREHSANEALRAIEAADKYFDEYSFDMIYALPDQSIDSWSKELSHALQYCKNHLSLYQLTIEKGTPFFKMERDKSFIMPGQDLSARFYLQTEDIVKNHGLDPYEVSNYASSGSECKHNLTYWKYNDYIGIGPGAHGRIFIENRKYATMTYHKPEKWMKQVMSSNSMEKALQSNVAISDTEQYEEKIMMGLRMRKIGIDKEMLHPKDYIEVKRMISMGFLEEYRNTNDNMIMIRPTLQGTLLLNSVTAQLLSR